MAATTSATVAPPSRVINSTTFARLLPSRGALASVAVWAPVDGLERPVANRLKDVLAWTRAAEKCAAAEKTRRHIQ